MTVNTSCEVIEEENNVARLKIGKWLFYLILSLELAILLVDKSSLINPIEGRMFQVIFLLCVGKVVITRYTTKEYVIIGLFSILGIISYLATGRNEILRFVFFFAASKDIELRSALKYVFYTILAGVILLIGLSLTGTLGSIALEENFGRGGVELRYCLGLGHPNSLHCMIWSLMTLFLYLYDRYMKWYGYLVLVGLTLFTYVLTVSKSGLLIGMGTIFLFAIMHYLKPLRKMAAVYIAGGVVVVGGVIFSILVAIYGLSLKFFVFLDIYLNGRIEHGHGMGDIASWSLFSNSSHQNYFDMGFIRLFYWYGIIPAIVCIALLGVMIYHFYKTKDYCGFAMLLAFAIYTVSEAHGVSVYIVRNFAMLLLMNEWTQMIGRNDGQVLEVKQMISVKK